MINLNRCPVCKSDNISANDFEAGFYETYRQVDCMNCDYQWNEVFRFSHTEGSLNGIVIEKEPYLKPTSTLDRIEMERAKQRLLAFKTTSYRGFSITNDGDDYYTASRPDGYARIESRLNTLLHIIFLITKE